MAPIVIAHRTCPRDAPENSLEGIRRAAELGADVVEIDVRLTRDGLPVLMHDATPRRTTGSVPERQGGSVPERHAGNRVPLRWIAATQVRGLHLANGEPVPTLAEALAALPPTLRVAIDVKVPRAIGATLAEVRNQRLESRTLLWSQHRSAVRSCVHHAPGIEPSLLCDARSPLGGWRFLRAASATGARGISAHWDMITPAFVTHVRRRGLVLYSWCTDAQPSPEKLRLVDGLVTDWPAEVGAAISSTSNATRDLGPDDRSTTGRS